MKERRSGEKEGGRRSSSGPVAYSREGREVGRDRRRLKMLVWAGTLAGRQRMLSPRH